MKNSGKDFARDSNNQLRLTKMNETITNLQKDKNSLLAKIDELKGSLIRQTMDDSASKDELERSELSMMKGKFETIKRQAETLKTQNTSLTRKLADAEKARLANRPE